MTSVDVLIAGGGIAGLCAAAALAHAGQTVLVAEPRTPRADAPLDLRSTAYLQPARHLFGEIGLWPELQPHATPLRALRVVDTRGWPPQVQAERVFEPSDLGADCFGWNLPNEAMRAVLLAHLTRQPGVELAQGVSVVRVLTRMGEARVRLSDGRGVRARLLVGADGRDSAVRAALGIGVQTQRYGQRALAFQAGHAAAHDGISTEIYNQGGAFTTVPLPDESGAPRSAIVWMQDGAEAHRLSGLAPADFDAEMTQRACGLLGPMQRLGPLNSWPVVTQTAHAVTAERSVLIAEAAHVMPPIGAQGLNTSLLDVAQLYAQTKDDPTALGTEAQLRAYARAREADTQRRAHAIDLFNRVCQSGIPMVQALRSAGLKAAHDMAPLRRGLMRAGLGG